MRKLYDKTINEIKVCRKLLITSLVIVLLITLLIFIFKDNEEMIIVTLSFASIFDKLLFIFFIAIGVKNYKSSLNNSLQINQSRTDYFIAKSFSILIISVIVSIVVTPLSYYLAELGKFDSGGFDMPLFIGYFEPIIPIQFDFKNILLVTIITIIIYNLIAQLSLLTIAFYNKFGFLKLFLSFTVVTYLINFINNYIIIKNTKYDIMNVILGYTTRPSNLLDPIIYLTLITMVVSFSSYMVINKTEVL